MTGLVCIQPHQIPKLCYLQYYNVAAKINANVPGSVQDPSGIPLFPVCDQRETLLRQLETNQLDIDATLEELSVQQETEDQNYDMCGLFLDLTFIKII